MVIRKLQWKAVAVPVLASFQIHNIAGTLHQLGFSRFHIDSYHFLAAASHSKLSLL
jgi:hypothetical protein